MLPLKGFGMASLEPLRWKTVKYRYLFIYLFTIFPFQNYPGHLLTSVGSKFEVWLGRIVFHLWTRCLYLEDCSVIYNMIILCNELRWIWRSITKWSGSHIYNREQTLIWRRKTDTMKEKSCVSMQNKEKGMPANHKCIRANPEAFRVRKLG